MHKRLYVGNLPYSFTKKEIKELFSAHGTVESVCIMSCRQTGQSSRGVAYVTMNSEDNALKAMVALNGSQV